MKKKATLICNLEIDKMSKKDTKDYLEFIFKSMDKAKVKKFKVIYDV